MQVNLSFTPGYRLKISRASPMSELVDRVITGLAALVVRRAGTGSVVTSRTARDLLVNHRPFNVVILGTLYATYPTLDSKL